MKLRLLQNVDSWLGKPLLWLLTKIRPGRAFIGGSVSAKPPRIVVVTKLIGLGSVVLAMPLLAHLKASGIRVVFLTFTGNAGLLNLSHYVDEVWVIDPRLGRVMGSSLSVLIKIWRIKPDAFVDLEPTSHMSAIFGAISPARQRIGFMSGHPLRESVFTHLVALTAMRHMSEHFAQIAQLLGLKMERGAVSKLPILELPAKRQEIDVGSRVGRKIVLNMTTSELGSYHRSWPDSSWRSLADSFLADEATLLLLPGLASDQARLEAFRQKLYDPERVLNLAGRTDLGDLLNLLHSADLVVSLDSGIAHLAAWVNAPLVCLFGPESPALYRPLSERMSVIWQGLHCSPCCTIATEKHTRCRDNQCMKQISVNQVRQACYAHLNLNVVAMPSETPR